MAKSPHSSSDKPEDLQSPRELIVMMDTAPRGARSLAEEPTSPIADLLASAGATMEPLFDADTRSTEGGAALSDESDTTYYHVTAADKQLDKLRDQLEQQPGVQAAYVKPPAEVPALAEAEAKAEPDLAPLNDMSPDASDAPAVTPNYQARQIYLNPAPAGVDAYYAWKFPGGRGNGINVIDLEWGWQFTHEDLTAKLIAGTNSSSTNHGTAVLGEIRGDANGFGVTGIAPNCRTGAVAFSMPTATAIRKAADNLKAGDIMLLEIHRAGPRHKFKGRSDQKGYIAVEWWPDDFAAIRYATNKGIVVVEAAGNGAENFDDALYDIPGPGFPASWRNPFNPANQSSRAVVVGAGAPPPGTHGRNHGPDRSRLGFSNYGARLDCQGWGREVTTTGYGDLQGGNQNRWYTDKFSGTSSASPIITGALACVNGALRSNGQPMLSPLSAISLLRSTGTPQTDAPGRPRSQRIGRRPDLKQMLNRVIKPRDRYTGVWRAGNDKHYLWVNASWSNFLAKWKQLAPKGLRLTDFEISKRGSGYVYSGVWRQGNDPYYLWVNATWSSFVGKWQQLAQQGLRLIDIEIKEIGGQQRYSGVWRGGRDPYYLWVNASWSSFVSKWQQLSALNMRLVDIEIRKIGNDYRYTGVWRQGTGAHYLWVNATWSSFITKWQQLARQNLRLTKIVRTNINGVWRYSGIWRPGNDSYYLWVNASWPSFVEKWQELSRKGLRLVDFELALEGDSAPVAPPASGDALAMILDSDTDDDGFGGGDFAAETLSVAGVDIPAPRSPGQGGGDYGQGFQVASAQPAAQTTGAAETTDGEGYGGGVLPSEQTEDTDTASSRGTTALDAAESDDGSGYGGGGSGGSEDEEETRSDPLAANEDGQGFGGGSFA
ncbi:S8 family peptidase [Loktanella agnita]|uniref:S8 family peptidase n=1 Tax=Loktanella agnita TaxID=287097 RepID=UPI003985DDF1